jgi:hypothetical protein
MTTPDPIWHVLKWQLHLTMVSKVSFKEKMADKAMGKPWIRVSERMNFSHQISGYHEQQRLP